jgi:hypothetical protein
VGRTVNLLIPYVASLDHPDPLLDEFTYGDVDRRALKLKNDLQKGDFVFFHTTLREHVITAYYVVDRVLDTRKVFNDRLLIAKYRNPHIDRHRAPRREDAILFGDPISSKKLTIPLPFGRRLAEKLSLRINFASGRTELSSIASATRAWRTLTPRDVDTLLQEIDNFEKSPLTSEVILSTDEILEFRETDLEDIIMRNPDLLGESLTFVRRQSDVPQIGRIDLLFTDKEGDYVIVELKLGSIGRDAATQIRRYMHDLKPSEGRRVRGIIICKDVLPAFRELYEKMEDVKVFYYGWKASLQPSGLELD